MMRRDRFLEICAEENLSEHSRMGIGTYMEKRLHIVLKKYMDPELSHHEIPVFDSVADIFDGDRITEIQTGSLRPLRDKLKRYLGGGNYDVEIVCPIAEKKYVLWMDPETGEIKKKNRSSRRGRPSDIIPELYYLLDFIGDERFSLRIVMLEIEEYRNLDGWSYDKKRGSTRYERIPVDIFSELELGAIKDYAALIPEELGDEFTSADFKKAARMSDRKTSYSLKTLSLLGLIERQEKKGRSYIYKKMC